MNCLQRSDREVVLPDFPSIYQLMMVVYKVPLYVTRTDQSCRLWTLQLSVYNQAAMWHFTTKGLMELCTRRDTNLSMLLLSYVRLSLKVNLSTYFYSVPIDEVTQKKSLKSNRELLYHVRYPFNMMGFSEIFFDEAVKNLRICWCFFQYLT